MLTIGHESNANSKRGADTIYGQTERWKTPHGMQGIDHTGKLGAGGEFAKQAEHWTTPQAHDEAGGNPNRVKRFGTKRGGANLADDVTLWPTPRTGEEKQGPSSTEKHLASGKDWMLTDAADRWSTPQAQDAKNVVQDSTAYKTLPADVLNWPTPASRDEKGANSEEHATVTGGGRKHMDQLSNFVAFSPQVPQTEGGSESSEAVPTSRPRLNPAFTAWLMGLPWWWTHPVVTNSVRSEMAEYRSALRSRLEFLLGGLSDE